MGAGRIVIHFKENLCLGLAIESWRDNRNGSIVVLDRCHVYCDASYERICRPHMVTANSVRSNSLTTRLKTESCVLCVLCKES